MKKSLLAVLVSLFALPLFVSAQSISKEAKLYIETDTTTAPSKNILIGSANNDIYKVKLTANGTENIKINKFLYLIADGNRSLSVDKCSTSFSSISLYDGTMRVGLSGATYMDNYCVVIFENINLIIPASKSKILTLSADISVSATNGTNFTFIPRATPLTGSHLWISTENGFGVNYSFPNSNESVPVSNTMTIISGNTTQTTSVTDVFADNTQSVCTDLKYNMTYRARDARTNGEVSGLQDFLIDQGYLSGEPTGYYGTLTVAAVKKFQVVAGLGNVGTPGFGNVGPKTRAYIRVLTCGSVGQETFTPTQPTSTTVPQPTVQTVTSLPRVVESFYLSKNSVDFSTLQMDSGKSLQQSLTLTNRSSAVIPFTISVPNQPAWLSTNYITTQLNAYPNSPIELPVSVSPGTIVPGNYSTTIIISGNFVGSPIKIPVNLTVGGAQTGQTTVDLKTASDVSGNSTFITASIAGNPSNRNVSYWLLTISCGPGVALSNVKGGYACGEYKRVYASDIYDSLQDYVVLTGTATNSSSVPANVVLALVAYDQNGNSIGGDKEGFILAAAPSVTATTTTPTIVAPTIEYLGAPTLSLQYDSAGKESLLVGKATVRITTGNSPINISYSQNNYHIANMLTMLNNEKGQVYANSLSYAAGSTFICTQTATAACLVPANSSIVFNIGNTAKTNELFAGTYFMDFSSFAYYDANTVSKFSILPQNIKGVSRSNSVTIVGERAPYLSSVSEMTNPSGVVVGYNIWGVRFSSTANQVTINGITKTLQAISSDKGLVIALIPSDFGITASGSYPVQVSTAEGASNTLYANIVVSGSTVSKTKPQSASLVGTQTTYTAGQIIKFSLSGTDSTGSIASPLQGLHVQAIMVTPGSGGAVMVNGVYQSVNATYNYGTKMWDVVMTAPSDSTKSYTITATFYCSNSSLGCDRADSTTPGNDGMGQIPKSFSFTSSSATPTPAPTVTITANPTAVTSGGSSTITWSSTNATSCFGFDGPYGAWWGSKNLSGSVTSPALITATKYTVSCSGPGGTTSQSVTVTVGGSVPVPAPQAPIVTSNAGFTSQTVNPGTVNQKIGSFNVTNPNNAEAFTLTTVKVGIEIGAITNLSSLIIKDVLYGTVVGTPVGNPLLTNNFNTNISLLQGMSKTFDVYADIGYGSSGSTIRTSMAITGVSASGVNLVSSLPAPASAITTVVAPVTPAPTVTITANPSTLSSSVGLGGGSMITWSSTDATSCYLSGDPGVALAGGRTSGTVMSYPISSTTTFSATCTGSGGSTTKSVTVTVTAPVTPSSTTLTASPTSVVSGGSSTVTWSATNVNYCTLTTGSINDPGPASAPLSGSMTVTGITSPRAVNLSCPGKDGVNQQKSLTIGVTAPASSGTPSITVTYPNGGETLTVGQTKRITWNSSGVDNVHVAYTVGANFAAGGFSGLIANSVPNTGYYDWNVNIPTGTQIKIRLLGNSTSGTTAIDDSDGFITVAAPIAVASQNNSQLASVIGAFTQSPAQVATSKLEYDWTRDLEYNSPYTDDVSALQMALMKEGVYVGEITGGFYAQTYLAVKAFQQKYGIEQTGFVGPATRAKLNALY